MRRYALYRVPVLVVSVVLWPSSCTLSVYGSIKPKLLWSCSVCCQLEDLKQDRRNTNKSSALMHEKGPRTSGGGGGGRCVSALRVRKRGGLTLTGVREQWWDPETNTLPAQEAAAALPCGRHRRSQSHYHSQNTRFLCSLYVNDLSEGFFRGDARFPRLRANCIQDCAAKAQSNNKPKQHWAI